MANEGTEGDELRTELQTEGRVNTTTDQSGLYGEKESSTHLTIFQHVGQDFSRCKVLGGLSSAPAGQRLEVLAAQRG